MRLRSQRGTGMVMSLIAIAVLALLGVTIQRLASTVVRASVYELRSAQAQAIAEAGLEDALRRLFDDPTWRTGFANKPFAGGRYTVTLSGDEPPWVTSTGYSQPIALLGPAVRSVRARARMDAAGGVRGWAIRAASGVRIRNNGSVDSYNSPLAVAADLSSGGGLQTPNCRAGSPVVQGRGHHAGNPAPDAQCFTENVVAGSSAALPSPQPCPAGPNNNGSLDSLPGNVWNPGTMDLTVRRNRRVDLYSGGNGHYCFNNLTVEDRGTLAIHASTAPVVVYLSRRLNLKRRSRVLFDAPENAAFFPVFGVNSGFTHTFDTDDPVYMDFQAPQAAVELIGGDFYGRLVGGDVKLNAPFHFDARFASGGTPTRVDWEPGTWTLGFDRP